jgi:lipopolysaccharide transport system permease protein
MKVRYKSSFLGYLWSIGNPLAFALVYWIAFKVVMKIQMQNYSLFLIAGLFPWQWFSNSVNASTTVFIGNSSVIKKVNFPRNVIPLALVLQDMIHFLLSVPVIMLFLFVYHKSPSASWIFGLPVLLAIQLFMTYGFALVMSSVNLFFRDMERLVSILLTFLFYFTPIFYPLEMVPEKYRYLIQFNPLAPLMLSWRDLFLDGRLDWRYIFLGFLYACTFYAAGYLVYKKLSSKFAEIL